MDTSPTRKRGTKQLALLVALCGALVGCDRPGQEPPAPSASPAAKISETQNPSAQTVALQILDFAGIEKLLGGHRGKVVVMDAWSTSCLPCRKEFPEFVALQKKYGPEKVACVSLSFDFEGIGRPEDRQGPVLKFLKQQNAAFDNILSSEHSDTLYRQFKLASVPAVFVYDRQGQLRKRFDNEEIFAEAEGFTFDDVDELVAELLAEPDAGE